MRTSAMISSSLLAIAVSGAPVDLPKLPVGLPSIATLPALSEVSVGNVNLPVRRTVNINAPTVISVDDLVELDGVNALQPSIAVSAVPAANLPVIHARDIKQSLPVVGGVDVPLDVGDIQVGTVDEYVDQLVEGIKIESLPKVARDISQSLPVVGGVDVPLDVGKIQAGTVDKYVDEVVNGITLRDVPVEQIVNGITVKDLPNLGSRDIKQSLPVVGGVDVPLDVGKIQVGTVVEYVDEVVDGTTLGL